MGTYISLYLSVYTYIKAGKVMSGTYNVLFRL